MGYFGLKQYINGTNKIKEKAKYIKQGRGVSFGRSFGPTSLPLLYPLDTPSHRNPKTSEPVHKQARERKAGGDGDGVKGDDDEVVGARVEPQIPKP